MAYLNSVFDCVYIRVIGPMITSAYFSVTTNLVSPRIKGYKQLLGGKVSLALVAAGLSGSGDRWRLI